jgi:hypothetical protein
MFHVRNVSGVFEVITQSTRGADHKVESKVRVQVLKNEGSHQRFILVSLFHPIISLVSRCEGARPWAPEQEGALSEG